MSLEIIAIVALAVIVAGGALVSIRVSKQRNRADTNHVTIRDVDTMGDVAGRDINKK
jgi:hypothetical protein